MHHPHSPFNATKPLTPNVEEEQQPEHVSINTSSSELSSSSKSSESSRSLCSVSGKEETAQQNQQPEPPLPLPLRKGSAFSVSGKEEAFRAQVRTTDQHKNSSHGKSSK